ncbi:uncharacterized protein [Ptychodera flava]|uniref:uncharacterized protein n=1 Tax=Ptychodera flava TaxID=63121 RepID=UPI00396A79C4
MSDGNLDSIISRSIEQVGAAYGVKMMQGYLRSKGFMVGRYRVQASLRRVNPEYHERRRNDTVRQTNPIPYYAAYHGDKLHVDQNEKLVRFGVTEVVFSDGYSRQIIDYIILPIKNPIQIYGKFRDILLNHGIWNTLRSDHGTEFCLTGFIQNKLKNYRTDTRKQAYTQTRSLENLRAERKWPEINQRVNYPVKNALIDLQRLQVIDMSDEMHRFCVSFVTTIIVEEGVKLVISSWNSHPLEGIVSRIPDDLARRTNRVARLLQDGVPTMQEAITEYEATGGNLTRTSYFGRDPLAGNNTLIDQRERRFLAEIEPPPRIFGQLVNGNITPFRHAIVSFINATIEIQIVN